MFTLRATTGIEGSLNPSYGVSVLDACYLSTFETGRDCGATAPASPSSPEIQMPYIWNKIHPLSP
jgi:hypothetical protein